jgi:hypothetical protein
MFTLFLVSSPIVVADEPDWDGSFSLSGSETRFAIGGFAQLDLIYDTDAIDTRCEFVTSAIPTDGGTLSGGADGQTSFCVNASRLTFESRTPTNAGRLKTFFSIDLFGDASSPSLRLRQAYGELEAVLWGGDLLIGQAWTTYLDYAAFPDVLDFEGPDSMFAFRQPMVRWSKKVSPTVEVRVAAEKPGGGTVDGAEMLTRWPDAIAVVNWGFGHGGHLQLSGILRDVRATADDITSESVLGWGLSGSGKVMLPGGVQDNLVFNVSYGEGTGGYYNDGPPNGAIDPVTSRLELLPVFGYYLGYEHGWSKSLSSLLLYSELEVDNESFQSDDSFHHSAYFALNLIWRPNAKIMYGMELLSGSNEDKDGADGTDNRIQLTGQFSF